MKAVRLKAPYELNSLDVTEIEEPKEPDPGEILVRIHASSLNFHDYAVVMDALPTQPNRIPLSDGAGVVEAVGVGVKGFKIVEPVVSCFAPLWQDEDPRYRISRKHPVMEWTAMRSSAPSVPPRGSLILREVIAMLKQPPSQPQM